MVDDKNEGSVESEPGRERGYKEIAGGIGHWASGLIHLHSDLLYHLESRGIGQCMLIYHIIYYIYI